MTIRTAEERVSFLEGAYDHMPTQSDVYKVERQLYEQIDQTRSELLGRLNETRAELSGRVGATRPGGADLRTEMFQRIDETRSDLSGRLDELQAEVRTGFADLRTEIAASEARTAKMVADAQAKATI